LLNLAEVRYLVLGGYAVNYYGYERTTADLDVWIAVDPTNAQNLSKALQHFAFPAESVPPSIFLEFGALIRFGRKPALIEILTNPSGIDFASCYSRKAVVNWDGVEVPLISLDDLKVNKKASGRPKDVDDLLNLP
jgi:hypothetical protein